MTKFTQARLALFIKALEESPVVREIGIVYFWIHNFSGDAELCINMSGNPNDLFRAFCLWFGADMTTTNFLKGLNKEFTLKGYFICELKTHLIPAV